MSGFKQTTFGDRLSEAAKARQAALEKFRTRPDPNDPAVLQRQAEREAVLAARAVREKERELARQAREKKEREEEVAREKAERESRVRRDQEEREGQARREEEERLAAIEREREHDVMLELEAEQESVKKAERDARYAARKARKKLGLRA